MSKTCKNCGRALVRKNYKYRCETPEGFKKRLYCEMECYRLYRRAHRKPPSGLTHAEAMAAREERHQARQTRPHYGFNLNLVREWLSEWR